MKIMQIMPEFGLAGAEIMCENLCYELASKNHDIVIVSLYTYNSAITERLENKNIKIYYLDKKTGLDLTMITKLIKVLKKENPKVIHTHRYVMQYAIPAAFLCGINCRVHTVHNVADKEVGKIARILAKIFYTCFNVTPVALSNIIKKTIIDQYHLKDEQVPVVVNGIDLKKCMIKDDYSIKDKFTVLHIGRFDKQKNHISLVKGFEKFLLQCPNSQLLLLGDGDLRDKIFDYVNKNNLNNNVKFLGLTNNVYPYLKNADVFILPSIYEGVPMTLIEAMGSAIPIIASRVGGIPDMLTDGDSALLINPNENAISEALIKIFNSKELRIKLGKNAFEQSKKFSAETMANKYNNIYFEKVGN